MTVNEALRYEFGRGMFAGIAETLDQLEGRGEHTEGRGYVGPMPEELKRWIADVRARMQEHQP